MDSDSVVRQELLKLLQGGNAHMDFQQAVAGFPMGAINDRPPQVDYSPWALLEHIRIAQSDILEFIRNPEHTSPPWPAGYWPPQDEKADPARWQRTIEEFRRDAKDLKAIVSDPATDLYSDLPHAEGYTIFREIVLVADHNSYHLGEFAILRQVMGTWRE